MIAALRAASIRAAPWMGPGALAVLAVLVACATLPLDGIAAQDSRMAAVFSSDEELIANGLERMIERRSTDYGFFWYPPVFMNLSVVCTWLLARLGMPLLSATVIVPRALASLFFIVAIVLTARLGRRLSGSWAPGLIAALSLAVTAELFRFAVMGHPDTLQLSLLLASLLCLIEFSDRDDRRWLWGASALAGVAFSTKYGGLFLVPPIVIAAVWLRWSEARPFRAAWPDLLRSGGYFVLGALVPAPAFLFRIGRFLERLRYHSFASSFGYFTRDTRSGTVWFTVLSDDRMLGLVLPIVFAGGLVVLAIWSFRERGEFGIPGSQGDSVPRPPNQRRT